MASTPEIVFVQMPFAGVERPSLALGLLVSELESAGLSAGAVYANIYFAEQVGLPAYVLMRTAVPSSLLGEWIFTEAAFGDRATPVSALPGRTSLFGDEDQFIDFVVSYRDHTNLEGLLLDLRSQASAFVDELSEQILGQRPKVVACTSMFDQHVASLALLQRLKERDPSILTVIGGANCAGPMGLATHRSFPAVDFTVTGEFDDHAASFFAALLAARGDAESVTPLPPNVLGPIDRLEGGRDVPPADIVRDMDRVAIPDYDDYFEQLYSSPISPYVLPSIPLETSRGCWWGEKQHCTFCGLNAEGMAFRKKSPERALREIRALTSRYHIYRFSAADNIIDMSYFKTVLPELAADEKEYNFFYETKANLKREHVEALARAGCNFIQPGIESLHDQTLQVMKKGTTACANIQLLKNCAELGVTPAWSILCDFPGTDPEWVAQIAHELPALFHLPPPNGTTPIRFDRFSPYHQRPGDYGLTLEPDPAYALVYPFAREVLDDLAYFFRQVGDLSERSRETAMISWHMTARWRDEFWSAERAELIIETDDGDVLVLRDTRRCASAPRHRLEGSLGRLLRALGSPTTVAGLRTRLQSAGWTDPQADEVEAGLAELERRHLIWRASSQLVALPTTQPARTSPSQADVAVGKVKLERYFLAKARFACAVA